MDQVYDWVRNLTGYFLFMAVLENLLPGKKYAKYIKFFAGIVLILLVLQPIAGSTQLEEIVARHYEAFVFQNQADDLRREILGVENQRLEQIFRQYEQAVESDVSQMAEDAGFAVKECRAVISGEEGTEQFGTVTQITLKIYRDEDGEGKQEDNALPEQIRIDPVELEIRPEEQVSEETMPENRKQEESMLGSQGSEKTMSGSQVPEESGSRQILRRQQEEVRTAAGKLRRKIAAYYNLEDNYVEIQIAEGER